MFAHTACFLYLCIVNKRKRTDDDGLINIRITIKEKKGKKIMVTLTVFAIVAIMIAQAINLGNKINLNK